MWDLASSGRASSKHTATRLFFKGLFAHFLFKCQFNNIKVSHAGVSTITRIQMNSIQPPGLYAVLSLPPADSSQSMALAHS
ncbi:unnamed protein product [Staurois parvus]|uniref:Uncharacterized protein n=1 Tax=Staurois parvus TaxID=386267 RepID=A0ABN9CI76_9NEOB|nr:unnamed protein product [Staurois parvus]